MRSYHEVQLKYMLTRLQQKFQFSHRFFENVTQNCLTSDIIILGYVFNQVCEVATVIR